MPRDTAVLYEPQLAQAQLAQLQLGQLRLFEEEPQQLPTDEEFAALEPHQRLKALTRALRLDMPRWFRWDFHLVNDHQGCMTVGCAIGLAAALWPNTMNLDYNIFNIFGFSQISPTLQRVFGLGEKDIRGIFTGGFNEYRYTRTVTPLMVARAIEKRLA